MALTRYPPGSIGELWRLSLPLMVSEFSVMLMLFVDRLYLAQFSQSAFNAAVSASTLGWAMIFGWMVLANISEVFVAQHNGAQNYERIGAPVWQMLWLGLASTLFFVPMAIWGGALFFGTESEYEYQRQYLSWMLIFGPSFPLYGALSGFFVGRGKVIIITLLSLATNIVNAALDWVLIFGIEGWVPSLGVSGAAIATSGSQIFQALILAAVFLKSENRSRYQTWDCKFRPRLFARCFRIGFPIALFATFEISGWALFYMIMTWASPTHITIAGISQSILILFYFFGEGVSKGTAAIAGNYIGSNKVSVIGKTISSGVKLNGLFFLFLLLVFSFFADELAGQFLNLPESALTPAFLSSLRICVFLVILYLLLDGLRFIYMGVLTAAGDTLFILIGGAVAIWILLVLPVYIAVIHYQASIETASLITVLFALGTFALYYGRYRSGRWKTLSINEPSHTSSVRYE